jgi:hypothetical protein
MEEEKSSVKWYLLGTMIVVVVVVAGAYVALRVMRPTGLPSEITQNSPFPTSTSTVLPSGTSGSLPTNNSPQLSTGGAAGSETIEQQQVSITPEMFAKLKAAWHTNDHAGFDVSTTTTHYTVEYNQQFHTFVIAVVSDPAELYQQQAENAIKQTLGLTDAQLCALGVTVKWHTPLSGPGFTQKRLLACVGSSGR